MGHYRKASILEILSYWINLLTGIYNNELELYYRKAFILVILPYWISSWTGIYNSELENYYPTNTVALKSVSLLSYYKQVKLNGNIAGMMLLV